MTRGLGLEVLSPEIQCLIMLDLDNAKDLFSLVRASARFYQVFRINKEIILSEVSRRQFSPSVRAEALFVVRLSELEHPLSREVAIEYNHTRGDIHRWLATTLSISMSTKLCKLARTIEYFTNDYAQNTLPILAQLGKCQDVKIAAVYDPVDTGMYKIILWT